MLATSVRFVLVATFLLWSGFAASAALSASSSPVALHASSLVALGKEGAHTILPATLAPREGADPYVLAAAMVRAAAPAPTSVTTPLPVIIALVGSAMTLLAWRGLSGGDAAALTRPLQAQS